MEENTKAKNIEKLESLYKNLSYFDYYSGSVLLVCIITFFVALLTMFFVVMKNANEIKNDWNVERCKPLNIAFAGFINKPTDETILEYTSENFNYCIGNILTQLTSYVLTPLNYIFSSIIDLYKDLTDAVNSIRTMINEVRTSTTSITETLFNAILNVITPIQAMFIAVIDSFGKTQGVLTAGLMTALGSYYTLQSLMGAIVEFLVLILIAMLVVILALWSSFFGWPAAVALSAIFVAIASVAIIIKVFTDEVLHIHTSSIPGLKCFDEKTKLELFDGSKKEIVDIVVGDVLKYDGIVSATMKLEATNETMYLLNDVIVSGSHSVYFDDLKKWGKVSNHNSAVKIDNYNKQFIYCLNTENKTITINDTIYSDWDELFNENLTHILNISRYNPKTNNIEKIGVSQNIHKFLDFGYEPTNKIMVLYPELVGKQIKDVCIGDVIDGVGYVYGIVKLMFPEYKISCSHSPVLYNVLVYTNKDSLFKDYNHCIDKFLI